MAVKTPKKAAVQEPPPEPEELVVEPITYEPGPDDYRATLNRLIAVVQTMWTDPYARPHCRKSGGLPRPGCDCPICAADAELKALVKLG